MHKIFFYNKPTIRLYMFRALCAHHQEVKIVLYSIWYRHTCRWPSGAQVERVLSQNAHRTATYRYDDTRQWRTEGGVWGVQPHPPEIPKTLQNRVKLNPIVTSVKNC